MRAFTSLAVALFAAVVSASSTDNPFNIPKGGYTFTVGQPTTLHWTPTTSGTVSLRLQHGDVTTSTTGTSIVSGIPNDGSYTWTVPADVTGQPYTIEILSDNNANDYNFLPKFTINGASLAPSSSVAPSTSSSAAMTTSTPGSTTSTSSSATPTSTKTTMSTSTSASATTSSESSSSAHPTKTESSTSSSAVTSTASVPTTNAGITNRVSGGMLAMVAGAIAVL